MSIRKLGKKFVFLGSIQFSSILLLSCDQLFANLWTTAYQASLSIIKLAQTHVHWVSDVIQPSHPLLSPSSPSFSLSQNQGIFQWVSSSYQVAKVLEFLLHHQSFQWVFRTDFFYDWLVWSSCSPNCSQESSPTPHFKSINSSVLSFIYSPTLTSIHDYWKHHSFD